MISVLRQSWAARVLIVTILSGLGVAFAPIDSRAQATDAAPTHQPVVSDTPTYTFNTESDVIVRPDRTSVEIRRARIKIAQEAAIRAVGQQSITFTEGMENFEIVEAFTQKADGRRVPVEASAILTRDAATGLNSVYQRDTKVKTLIFPDLAVGDTLVYTTRREINVPSFEGHFVYSALYQRSHPWERAVVTIEVSKDLDLKVAMRGTGLTYSTETVGNSVRYRFTYLPPARTTEEPGAVSPIDREPLFVVSTFKNYTELGAAYWKEVADKVVVTPEIQALADEITHGIDDKRAAAAAIDRWVKRSVRYVAVYLGRQRWIPNPAQRVLANRYGDCKDHATLMSALLAARNIASEHVLINLGNSYILPELPPGSFNHVILFLPDFNLYVDPTSTYSSFGILAPQTYDKPVLHASARGFRIARTPTMKADDHTTISRTTVHIAVDGTMAGETVQTASGFFAALARQVYANIQNTGPERAAENSLNAFKTPGKGRYSAPTPSELNEPYSITASFTLRDKIGLPLKGNRRIPFGLPIHARPSSFLLGTRKSDRREPFPCFAGRQREEIDITFADGLPLPRRINPQVIETGTLSYRFYSDVAGRSLKLRREFVSKVNRQVCGPTLEAELAGPFKVIQLNFAVAMDFPPSDLMLGKTQAKAMESISKEANPVAPARGAKE
jgi:Domain of Unknown Function with PDB structure (DUF3857)/Transglutaminase-like superfamily